MYVVGGAVRDELLGRLKSDRDWVLVGAKPEDLLPLGFKPVGADFPVFLHPHTQDEYALARTERKSGHGYKGFTFYASPDVTLQDDLARRDFTVNAMAMAADGSVIDPFNGFSDLNAGVMRHVSPAFAEDPLRILRLARFLARFTTFSVADETLYLCRQLVRSGEIAHLVPERVFTELNKGMSEPMPSRMIQLLVQLQAWPVLLDKRAINERANNERASNDRTSDDRTPHDLEPKFGMFNPSADILLQLNALQGSATTLAEARWVYLLGCFEKPATIVELAHTLRMPSQLADEARVAAQVQALVGALNNRLGGMMSLESKALFIELFSQVDVYRKPDRLLRVLSVLEQIPSFSINGGFSGQSGQTEPVNWAPRALEIMRQAAQQLLSDSYKSGLRQFMKGHPGVNPADLVAQFRSDWVAQLLQA